MECQEEEVQMDMEQIACLVGTLGNLDRLEGRRCPFEASAVAAMLEVSLSTCAELVHLTEDHNLMECTLQWEMPSWVG